MVGRNGLITNSGNTTTNYTLGAGDNASFWLYFKAKGACADTLSDSVLVSLAPYKIRFKSIRVALQAFAPGPH